MSTKFDNWIGQRKKILNINFSYGHY